MLNVKFNKKQKTLNESLQASGQALLLEGVKDELLQPLLDKYKGSVNDFKALEELGYWPEITPGPKKPNVKGLSGPEKAEAFREYNRLRKEAGEKNSINQEKKDRKVALIRWAGLMYLGKKENKKEEIHPPSDALDVVRRFLDKLETIRNKYGSNKVFKKKVDELSSGTNNDPLHIEQFTSEDMRQIIGAIEAKVGDVQGDSEQARKDKIGETENWEVFMPSTMASSCQLGKGTTWCTARTRGDNRFSFYVARENQPVVLFYVIKKNAGTPPKEHPKDYLSLGYDHSGRKIEDYSRGGVNIDSDNKGVRPEEFASIVGDQEAKEVYRIIEKRFKTFTEHPMKEKLREAAKDPKAFNSLFTKGMSLELIGQTLEDVYPYGPLSPRVQSIIKDKIMPMIFKKKVRSSTDQFKFKDLQYPKLDLGGANLENIAFDKCNLEGSNFKNVIFKSTPFWGCNLVKANFAGAKGASNFAKANLEDAVFLKADIKNTFFAGANLKNADFTEANLDKSNFIRANLEGANLEGASLQGANFQMTKLQGARYNSQTKFPVGFNPEEAEDEMINTDAKQSNQNQQQQQELREFKEFLKDRRMI